jgi:hypothetical protein
MPRLADEFSSLFARLTELKIRKDGEGPDAESAADEYFDIVCGKVKSLMDELSVQELYVMKSFVLEFDDSVNDRSEMEPGLIALI